MMNHKLAIQVLTLLASIVLISACGGGTASAQNQTSGTPTVVIPGSAPTPVADELINGIKVPPDPGAAKDATLAGIDSDNNGIRDEIDRWIATKFGDKPGALEPIRMVAQSDQELLLSTPINQKEALAVAYKSMDVGGCVGDKLRSEGLIANAVFNESMVRTYNTRERIDAVKKADQMAGMIVRSVAESTITCPYKR
jgi:hypothetical protein